jgi:diguanylate cyclase (GGDEF)-like protein
MDEDRLISIRQLALPSLLTAVGLSFMAANGQIIPPGWAMFPLAALFALVVSDWLRGLLRSFSMSFLPTEIAFILGFFLMAPADLVAGIALAAVLVLVINGRRAPVRALVNGMMGVGFSSLAVTSFHLIGFTSVRDPRAWVAALALTVAVELVSEGFVAADVRIRSGAWPTDLREAVRTGPALTVVNSSLALVAVVLLDVHPAAPLLLVPAVLIFARAYRAHMGRNDDVRRLTLMKVVSTLSPTFEETVDRPQLLSLVASVTNADVVDLTIPSLEPPRMVWQLGELSTPEVVSLAPPSSAVCALTESDLAVLGAPDVRRPWRSGIGVRFDDGPATLGWISIGRGSDYNPSPFDELDRRTFSLLAGVVSGFVARGMLITAVAERDEQATHLRYRAMHDGLTKVLAAHEFRAELARATSSREPGNKQLIFIDLDGFKPINDHHGHAAGDAVLIEIATRLRQAVRAHDVVGRMGGDEFAVLADLVDSAQVDEIAQRLLAAIERPVEFQGESLRVSASIGVAPLGSETAEELLMDADAAMYQAKAAGGARWRHAGQRAPSTETVVPRGRMADVPSAPQDPIEIQGRLGGAL